MSGNQNIDHILEDWPFEPGVISARVVHADDGRKLVQMRVEMGLLQMETTGRPDGTRPDGSESLLDALIEKAIHHGDEFELDEDQCFEVDREFMQFYHRRICLLALRDFDAAVRDADHTLALMDLAAKHSPDPEWTLTHEQYRPLVLFHRTQATAMARLKDSDAEGALDQISAGLERLREVFATLDMEEQFESNGLVRQLTELKDSLHEEYDMGPTLAEQLAGAVAAEEYERAAQIRDKIAKRSNPAT